jgi:hypothetical protein
MNKSDDSFKHIMLIYNFVTLNQWIFYTADIEEIYYFCVYRTNGDS